MTSRGSLNKLTALGLFTLALANVISFFLQRHTAMPESLVDPVVGFVYGSAIAITLLGVWRQARCHSHE